MNFHVFLGSDSAQILIYGLEYLRDPPPRGTLASWWGPLTILPQNIVLGALFGQNEVLEMHLTPLLDQLSVLEQKN